MEKEAQDGSYIYFSFSFENINNTNISEYKIYYSLDTKYDDRAFKSSSNYYSAINSRIKNNRYTFYYKLPIYYVYDCYVCLKPGNETLQNNNITIT